MSCSVAVRSSAWHHPPIFGTIEQYTDKCSHADAQTQLLGRAHPDLLMILFHEARPGLRQICQKGFGFFQISRCEAFGYFCVRVAQ